MLELAIYSLDQGGKKGRAGKDMWEPLRSNFAKWALKSIGERVGKPGASGPSVGKSPNYKTGKKGEWHPPRTTRMLHMLSMEI